MACKHHAKQLGCIHVQNHIIIAFFAVFSLITAIGRDIEEKKKLNVTAKRAWLSSKTMLRSTSDGTRIKEERNAVWR